MFEKIYGWIGRNAFSLVTGLAFLVAANVLLQAYMHKTTALLAWKGGGFGMYTEPHVEDRSVWLTFNGRGETASVRLWPETKEFAAWQEKAGVKGVAFLSKLRAQADRLRYFPRDNNAQDLIGLAARVRWPEGLVGDVVPAEGKVFKRDDISVVVYENRYDVDAQNVTRETVFEILSGGQS